MNKMFLRSTQFLSVTLLFSCLTTVPMGVSDWSLYTSDVNAELSDDFISSQSSIPVVADQTNPAVTETNNTGVAPQVEPVVPAANVALVDVPSTTAPVVTTPVVNPEVSTEQLPLPVPPVKAIEQAQLGKLARFQAWFMEKYRGVILTKDNVVDYLKDFKARGWSKWSAKEKAAVVITTAAVTALVSYGIYKAYKAYTKKEENKNKKEGKKVVYTIPTR